MDDQLVQVAARPLPGPRPRGTRPAGGWLAGARAGDVGVSAAIAVAVAVTGAALGYDAFAPGDAAPGTLVAHTGSFGATFGTILVQNVGAVLLAFTGVLTWGIGTLAALMTTSAWVGATAHAVVSEIGAVDVLRRALPYAFLEFGGLLLAATGGLYPAVVLVLSLFRDAARQHFGDAVRSALRLLAGGLVLVVLGAAVEALVIVGARP